MNVERLLCVEQIACQDQQDTEHGKAHETRHLAELPDLDYWYFLRLPYFLTNGKNQR